MYNILRKQAPRLLIWWQLFPMLQKKKVKKKTQTWTI